MTHYLDPKNDLTFKRIFGEHPDLLIDFLNALMPLTPDRLIEEIEYLPVEQVPDILGRKNSLVDVKCKDKNGRIFIVEMQMFWTDEFMQRIVFNASKAYVRQLEKNKNYNLLQPVYTLAILNNNFDHKTEQFYHHYSIINKENTEEVIEGLEFVLVELTKFKPEKWNERKIAALWLRFLNEVGEEMRMLPPELAAKEKIRKAAELCEEGAFTEEELATYEAYWDCVRVEKTLMESALREGLAKGLAKGLAEGLAKGLAEGEEIGLEKGRAESKAEVVINSHRKGIPIETITTITDLTIEQVDEILKGVQYESLLSPKPAI
jgi:predicted transposase/invertase (TIGR01784 family)